MIYDCFSFFNELDLLEIRLNTLDKVVDRFVISESHFSHTGKAKPLFFKNNESRYARFKDKIIHVVAPDPDERERTESDIAHLWLCEQRQRNATIRAIEPMLRDDDILIISDIDEIPAPSAIRRALAIQRPVRLRHKFYYYYLNYRCCTSPYWTNGTIILSYKNFRNPSTYAKLSPDFKLVEQENALPTASKARALKGIKTIRKGGWHFSYVGGVEKILLKLGSIVEGRDAVCKDEATIAECITSGNDIYGRGEWFFAENPSSGFPARPEDYPQLFFPVDKAYLRSVRFKRIAAYLKWIVRPFAWKLLPHGLAMRLSKKLSRI